MEMICQGPDCGIVFEAKRKNAKYHDKACSVRASRAGRLGEATPAGPGRGRRVPVAVASELGRTTRRALEAVDRVDTWAGQAALVLAARIDRGGAETGSALASMIKEHALAMDRALAEARQGDPVEALQDGVAKRAADDVARQREKHGNASAS
jgi:hypothetical protein